jgi:hypothetical protein
MKYILLFVLLPNFAIAQSPQDDIDYYYELTYKPFDHVIISGKHYIITESYSFSPNDDFVYSYTRYRVKAKIYNEMLSFYSSINQGPPDAEIVKKWSITGKYSFEDSSFTIFLKFIIDRKDPYADKQPKRRFFLSRNKKAKVKVDKALLLKNRNKYNRMPIDYMAIGWDSSFIITVNKKQFIKTMQHQRPTIM